MANIAKSVVKELMKETRKTIKLTGKTQSHECVTYLQLGGHCSSLNPTHDQKFGYRCWLHARVR